MKNILFAGIITLIFFGCKKENPNDEQEIPSTYSITGVAQKGPFPQGSKVTVYELNNKLEQTGKVFTTETSDDFGSFALKDMLLTSTIVQVEVEGIPYNEALPYGGGYNMGDQVSISNIVDLKKGVSVNVNLLSDLSRQRMKFLIQNGTGFDLARTQAEKEVMKVFGLDSFYVSGSETMDITQSGDASGSLLAMSAIFLSARNEQYKMFLQQYISKVRSDLETDGIITDTSLSNLIILALVKIDPESIRTTLSTYYKKDISSFSKYVDVAKIKLSVGKYSTGNITFPVESGNIFAMIGDTIYLSDTNCYFKFKFPDDGFKKLQVSISADSIDQLNIWTDFGSTWTLTLSNNFQKNFELYDIGKTTQINISNSFYKKGLIYLRMEDISENEPVTIIQKWFELKHY